MHNTINYRPAISVEQDVINKEIARKDYRLQVCIKTPISRWEVAHKWGDFHFAIGLRKELVALGYSVLILLKDEDIPDYIDVVLVFRGLKSKVEFTKDKLLLMWNISHPDNIEIEEYNSYDHVFVASQTYSNILQNKVKAEVEPLLQCTDPSIFKPVDTDFKHEALFIGNSRNEFREVVAFAIDARLDLSVYGSNWERFIDKSYIKGEYVSNDILNHLYSSTKILLNDHWEDMRRHGFISNRIFDALACNTPILSDYVDGLDTLFPNSVYTYINRSDFLEKIGQIPDREINTRREIIDLHTFAHRAKSIHEVIKKKI